MDTAKIFGMKYKRNILIAVIIITVLSWIDYEYLTAGKLALAIPDSKRKMLHIVFLALITITGYFGWSIHPVRWIKTIWLLIYIFGVSVLLLLEMINLEFHLFHTGFMKTLGSYRALFCSPIPFFILYVLARIKLINNKVKNKDLAPIATTEI